MALLASEGIAHKKRGVTKHDFTLFDLERWMRLPPVAYAQLAADAVLLGSEKVVVKQGTVLRVSEREARRLLKLSSPSPALWKKLAKRLRLPERWIPDEAKGVLGKQPGKKEEEAPPKDGPRPPLLINANIETLVLQLPGHLDASVLQDLVSFSFMQHQSSRTTGEEWLAFIGEEPHWEGLTLWLALSENAEVVADTVQSTLEAAGHRIGREGCNPSRHQGLQPSVRLSDEGLELLVPFENSAYVSILANKLLRLGQKITGTYQAPSMLAG